MTNKFTLPWPLDKATLSFLVEHRKLSDRQIGALVGRTRSTVSGLRQKYGLAPAIAPMRKKPHPVKKPKPVRGVDKGWPPSDADLLHWKVEGLSNERIGAMFGLSKHPVSERLKRIGYDDTKRNANAENWAKGWPERTLPDTGPLAAAYQACGLRYDVYPPALRDCRGGPRLPSASSLLHSATGSSLQWV